MIFGLHCRQCLELTSPIRSLKILRAHFRFTLPVVNTCIVLVLLWVAAHELKAHPRSGAYPLGQPPAIGLARAISAPMLMRFVVLKGLDATRISFSGSERVDGVVFILAAILLWLVASLICVEKMAAHQDKGADHGVFYIARC